MPVSASVAVWIGNDQQWYSPYNWSTGVVPDRTTEVHVHAVNAPYVYPVLNLLQEVGDMYLENGAHIKFIGELQVYGNFYGVNNLPDDLYTPTSGISGYGGTGLVVMVNGGNIDVDNELTLARLRLDGPTVYDGNIKIKETLHVAGGDLTGGTKTHSLTLLSNADGTGLVINRNGYKVLGNVSVQRYIDPSNYNGLGYRHYSTPVASTTVSDLSAPGTGGFTPLCYAAYNTTTFNTTSHTRPASPFPNVFYYDETKVNTTAPDANDFVSGYQSPASTSATLAIGKGYSVYIDATATVDLVGVLNDSVYTISGLTNGGYSNSGWHLLGNPYPSPIDWDLVSVPSGFGSSIAVNRPKNVRTAAVYGYYDYYANNTQSSCTSDEPTRNTCDAGHLIPMMQGFFIQRTATSTGTFTFENSARVTSYENPAFYRSALPAVDRSLARLRLTTADNRERTNAVVYFQEGATGQRDDRFDAERLPIDGLDHSVIFTAMGGKEYAINGLAPLTELQSVPLELLTLVAGKRYSVTATDLENFAPGTRVVLEDKLTGVRQDLAETVAYTFVATGTTATGRFLLHFDPTGKMATSGPSSALQVEVFPTRITAGESVQCLVTGAAGATRAEVYDAYGKQLLTRELDAIAGGVGTQLATQALARGVYTVRLSSGSGIVTRRVVVQ